MSVKIAVLGEVSACVGQRSVDLGTPRQRCVLAALAVDAGRLVLADRLVERVWGVDPPRRGRAALHTHLSRLRGAFAGAVAIVHRSDGYVLEVDQPERAVDLLRFRALRDQARSAADDTRRVALLTDALAVWCGLPLSGLSGEWVDGERDRWQQDRRAAEHELVDAQLSIGLGDELVAPLSARATQHPLDERVAGQYMLALHRAGRSADALDHYRQLRKRLAEDLGTDPGTGLQHLHRQILAADPTLNPTPGGTTTEPMVIPRQLPATPALFVGRRGEIDRLDTTLPTSGPSKEASAGAMVLISAIGGTGGIGKTWLALTWAHRNLERFPHGQLFVDLHGFSPAGRPAHPADVLGGFLEALGIDRDRQPNAPDGRGKLYRSLLADKRMLIVLDNAASTDQVTPLLPGGPHCTVLITSRNHLRGLIARHGAHPVHLDVLTNTEAHTLLTTALGIDRAATNASTVAELIDLCGGFPLALGLIAARITADPHLPLTDIVTELRALGVDALASDDPTASLPTVLSWSLHHLTDQQRQVFALLGITPGPDIGLTTAACLAALPARETHNLLRALADSSLIDRLPGNRYGMHDLVRAFATATATAHRQLPDDAREAAQRRVLDLYTHTAHAADQLLDLHREPTPLDVPTQNVPAHSLKDTSAALAWFDAEYPCLLAAQQVAATLAWHLTVWKLAWALVTFQYRRGHFRDHLNVWQTAADAATHLPNPTTRMIAYRYLGEAHAYLGHDEDALEHLHQALKLAEHHHDTAQQARIHYSLTVASTRREDDRTALEHAHRALDLYRDLDHPVQQAIALGAVGFLAARSGDYDSARDHCQAALALNRRYHDLESEAATLDSLGYIDHNTGHHTDAIDRYRDALTLFRSLENTYEVANTLDNLGQSHAAIGQREQAQAVWQEALQLYEEQGRHYDSTRIQHQLDGPDHESARRTGIY